MSLKDEWKKAGVNIGHAFRDAGKALGVTAKVVVQGNNSNGEGKKSKTGEAWTKAGHGFADAGKALGKASASTVEKVFDDEDKSKEEKIKVDEDKVIDAEFKDKEEK